MRRVCREFEWVRAVFPICCLSVILVASVGCATGSGGDESRAASPEEEPASANESKGAGASRGKRSFESARAMTELIGERIEGDRPPGCAKSWERLSESPFERGEAYYCGDFRGPDRWSDSAVVFTLGDEGSVLGISVQVFHPGNASAENAFDEFTGSLLERCENVAGYERAVIFDCGDYVVDARWEPGHGTVEVRYLFAENRDLLPG